MKAWKKFQKEDRPYEAKGREAQRAKEELMSVELHGLSSRLSVGFLLRKAQVKIVENILESSEARHRAKYSKPLRVHPRLYQVNLLEKDNYAVRLEIGPRAVAVDPDRTVR